jgi:hypothetical protein
MERIMSLTQKSRTEIYRALSELGADPDAVEEFLSHFPSRDLDEPVTKEFLRAEAATLRAEMAEGHGQLRAEMLAGHGQLRAEIAELRTEMHRGFQRMTLSLAALMVSMTGVTVAALTIAR